MYCSKLRKGVLVVLLIAVVVMGLSIPAAHAAPVVIATIDVGDSPYDVAVNAATNRIYVANRSDATVSVIDGLTNTVIDTVNVGNNPHRVAVNPVTNRIYVVNSPNSIVSVIDGLTNTVIDTVPVVKGVRCGG